MALDFGKLLGSTASTARASTAAAGACFDLTVLDSDIRELAALELEGHRTHGLLVSMSTLGKRGLEVRLGFLRSGLAGASTAVQPCHS